MNFEKLKELFNSIDLEKLQQVNIDEKGRFELMIQIAFVKSIELNQIIQKKEFDENSFLYLSTLRGVCEEIIILKYIRDFINEKDQNLLIDSIMKESTHKELIEQEIFINKYRPAQPVLDKSFSKEFPGTEISTILKRNKINGKRLPPTVQMAEKTGFKELYDYIYRASCSFVHFNPRIMLRTIWYKNNNPKLSNISIKNFSNYYFFFSSFYSSYMSVLLYKTFERYLAGGEDLKKIMNELEDLIKHQDHFPELVTFEECNIKRPNTKLTVINRFLKNKLFDNI